MKKVDTLRMRLSKSILTTFETRGSFPFSGVSIIVGVHGFKGSGVQGSILISGLHLGCVFTIKASVSSALIQNLKPNWQLLGKMNICNEDF